MSFTKVAKPTSNFSKVAKPIATDNFVFQDGNNYVFQDDNNYVFDFNFEGAWNKVAKPA